MTEQENSPANIPLYRREAHAWFAYKVKPSKYGSLQGLVHFEFSLIAERE